MEAADILDRDLCTMWGKSIQSSADIGNIKASDTYVRRDIQRKDGISWSRFTRQKAPFIDLV